MLFMLIGYTNGFSCDTLDKGKYSTRTLNNQTKKIKPVVD